MRVFHNYLHVVPSLLAFVRSFALLGDFPLRMNWLLLFVSGTLQIFTHLHNASSPFAVVLDQGCWQLNYHFLFLLLSYLSSELMLLMFFKWLGGHLPAWITCGHTDCMVYWNVFHLSLILLQLIQLLLAGRMKSNFALTRTVPHSSSSHIGTRESSQHIRQILPAIYLVQLIIITGLLYDWTSSLVELTKGGDRVIVAQEVLFESVVTVQFEVAILTLVS